MAAGEATGEQDAVVPGHKHTGGICHQAAAWQRKRGCLWWYEVVKRVQIICWEINCSGWILKGLSYGQAGEGLG